MLTGNWIDGMMTCGVSLLTVTLLTVMTCRVRQAKHRAGLFSASLGIIIFLCVKSVLIDCGWEFAALFGVTGGWATQLAMTLGTLAFFREAEKLSTPPFDILPYFPLICFGVGRHWLHSVAECDAQIYAVGEGVEFSLVLWAALNIRGETEAGHCTEAACKGMGIALVKAVLCALPSLFQELPFGFLGAVLLTAGAAGLVVEFTKALRLRPEIAAGGFAAGFTAALCVTTLLG